MRATQNCLTWPDLVVFAGSYTTAGRNQLERFSDKGQLYRTRRLLDRKGFLMSISISSLPR